jgi:hypothetical protein
MEWAPLLVCQICVLLNEEQASLVYAVCFMGSLTFCIQPWGLSLVVKHLRIFFLLKKGILLCGLTNTLYSLALYKKGLKQNLTRLRQQQFQVQES